MTNYPLSKTCSLFTRVGLVASVTTVILQGRLTVVCYAAIELSLNAVSGIRLVKVTLSVLGEKSLCAVSKIVVL